MIEKLSAFTAATLALSLAFPGSASAAEQKCQLARVTALDLGALADGRPTVPVTIAGHAYTFLFMPNVRHSAVGARVADALRLETHSMPRGVSIGFEGTKTRSLATLTDFRLGEIHADRFEVVLLPPDWRKGVDGIIGFDLLSRFDVDLDIGARKLNLFSPDHCPGKVVYWASSYAVVPIKADAIGLPYFKATLDGKEVTASFTMSTDRNVMGMTDANDIFGIYSGDPKLKALAGHVGIRKDLHSYPFRELALGGVAVRNPEIAIYPETRARRCEGPDRHLAPTHQHVPDSMCFGISEVRLGRSVVRQLHLYFAFGEKKLYVTAADPAAAAPASAGK